MEASAKPALFYAVSRIELEIEDMQSELRV
jgi:hypothetical protein